MSVRQALYQSQDPYSGITTRLPFNGFGWGSTSPVFQQVIDEIKPRLIVEVGSWMGASARHMAELASKHHPDVEIVCVDTWLASVEHWVGNAARPPFVNGVSQLYHQFLSNTLHAGLQSIITPFPIDSVNGGLVLKHHKVQADLIYIDAGHEYESVSADLKLYKDLVRPGGILLGDDYHHQPIIQAAADVLGHVEGSHGKFIWHKPT